jgi:hypothetical protein
MRISGDRLPPTPGFFGRCADYPVQARRRGIQIAFSAFEPASGAAMLCSTAKMAV